MTRSCGLPLCHFQLNGHLVENDTDSDAIYMCQWNIKTLFYRYNNFRIIFFFLLLESSCFYSALTKINFIY